MQDRSRSSADRKSGEGNARMIGATIESTSSAPARKSEFLGFLFLTVVLAPVASVVVVGGYGFMIWMFQLIAGPPGS